MAATQLSFTLRTSTNVKTTHLVGSWDNYAGQLPLSKDTAKAGAWKGTFKFSSTTLKQGQRYWYYYIMDGYHVSHDPAKPSTKEPTTGRFLNILDVPKSTVPAAPAAARRDSVRQSVEIPKGRSLSPSKIAHPRPSKPYASRAVREADYSLSPEPMEGLTAKLEQASLYKLGRVSPASSVSSDVSSRCSSGSSPSSLSSLSSVGSCRCWGVTRSGSRVKIDCGGSRCSDSDDDSSECSSSEESSDSESEARVVRSRGNAAVRRR